MNLFQQKKQFKIIFWLWALTLFILSSIPNIPTQQINIWDEPFRLDYLEHFGVFFLLGVFYILWKLEEGFVFSYVRNGWYMIALWVFASLNELQQIWIPGRTFNPLDLIYNTLGLVVVFIVFPPVLKRIYKK